MEGGILGILGKIGFDWQVALVNLVNFLIIFFILKHLAFKPIQNVIEKRQRVVKEGLENADRAKQNLLNAEQEKESIVMEARQKANDILAQAKTQADVFLLERSEEAKHEHDRIVLEGKKKAEKELELMKREIKGQAADLIVTSVGKILGETINETEDKKLRERAVTMMRN
jgi:F-type H+-transporting ATPase subunit b